MAYGENVTIVGTQYKNITPNMEDYDTPSPYHVTCRGEYVFPEDGRGKAYQSFSDPPVPLKGGWGWNAGGTASAWIMFDFSEPTEVDMFTYVHTGDVDIYGSLDGVNFTHITGEHGDGVSTGLDFDDTLVKHSLKPDKTVKYQYYRFTPSNTWNALAFIRFYVLPQHEKYLIKDSSGYKTINNGNIQNLNDFMLTKESIKGNAFEDISEIINIVKQLDNTFSILRYDENCVNTQMNIRHLPLPQLILPIEDIDLSAYHQIHQLSLTTTGTAGAVKMVFSFDKGETWHTFSDGAWQQIALSTDIVQASGITSEMLSAIPSEQWNQAVAGTLRVAYCLSKSAVTDDLAVDTLAITGNVSTWRKAQHMVDYDYEYPNPRTLLVHLLADGSYKINYTM